ncbi:rhodanese-like domain-containing protein [Deinococcus petrolearius]|uniref:Rhodanese-like domain-containing protein n=1 Tax=Deinococcus petrolearius TaxID=1751295 RepID=A0ABW1DHJ3_9DEIO
MPHDAPSPRLPPDATILDLRAGAARQAHPLAPAAGRRVLVLGLDEVEDGTHGLTPASGPLVVVCERGARSQLAARYLRADGLDAQAWPGGWESFAAALAGS